MCIQEIIEDSKSLVLVKTVKVQKVENECHFWLNTDATHWHGTEFIVNEQCDTICMLCGLCVLPKCYEDYDISNWQTIWEK